MLKSVLIVESKTCIKFSKSFLREPAAPFLIGYKANRKCKRFPEARMSSAILNLYLWSSVVGCSVCVAKGPSLVQTVWCIHIKIGKGLTLFPKGGRFGGSNKTSFCCLAFLVSYLSFEAGIRGVCGGWLCLGCHYFSRHPFWQRMGSWLPASASLWA